MGLFSKEKTVKLEDIRSPEAKALGKQYLNILQEAIPRYRPGEDFGDVSVGLTAPERTGLGFLDEYLREDIRDIDLYQAGRGEIADTLGGEKYDPTTGQFYKATRAGMDLARQEAIDLARRSQGIRGAFRSSGALRQEGDILTKSAIEQQRLLGELAERERERRLRTAEPALKLAEFEAGIPLEKTRASQLYGALERENELQNLENEYNKWRNQRNELMSAFTSAGQASNYGQPIYGKTSFKTKKPTAFGEIAGFAMQAAPMFAEGGVFGGLFN